jgi:hypothetical protein
MEGMAVSVEFGAGHHTQKPDPQKRDRQRDCERAPYRANVACSSRVALPAARGEQLEKRVIAGASSPRSRAGAIFLYFTPLMLLAELSPTVSASGTARR